MTDILSWWNLLFLVPVALSALFLLMNSIGLGSDAEADAEAEAEADLHEGASFDSAHDMDHDLAADHDMDHDMDHDAHQDTSGLHHGSSHVFIEFLGAGRIPITLIFQIFFLSWGLSGWLLNR